MYETYFGLNKRPFRALAAGTDVFVGPQTATTMAALKKAMAAPDTIVAVSGPVGSGKTTLVRRALDSVGDNQTIISVGRMQLGHDEVLELLLEEMGAELPAGTVQRFTTFRRKLKEQADKGTRVIIVVEDATRVGIDALSELEALTASDAGVSEGANIVLMGDQDMNDALKEPRLARLRQRLRLRQTISPLSAGELTAYFKHCFRLAGNEFDTLFEPGTANVLHSLSGGIPRMANNLVESVLTSAAESKQDRIGVALIKLIATEEYGLEAGHEAPAAVAPAAPATPVEIEKAPEMPTLPVEEEPADTPEPEAVAEKTPVVDKDDAIPELIQDTLPDLEILAPDLATVAEVANADVPEWERDPTLAQLRPDLDALEHAMAVAQGLEPDTDADEDDQNVPDKPPERVPEITLDREIQAKIDEAAELLKQAEREAAEEEKAAAEAAKEAPKATPPPSIHVKAPQAPQAAEKVEPPPAPKPEIKVEPPSAPIPVVQPEPPAATKPVVQARVEPKPAPKPEPVVQAKVEPKPAPKPEPVVQAKAEPEPAPIPVIQPEPEPEIVLEPAVAAEAPEVAAVADEAPQEETQEPDAALEQIAVDIARAKTIDDCDDKMAETLFGEEFSMMAAQVAANAPPELSANDELELAIDESGAVPLGNLDGAAAVSIGLKTKPNGTDGNFDPTASQRLATVRALNGTPDLTPPPAAAPVSTANIEPPPVADHPESIEEQINTSMTQTLKALNTHRPPADDDEDEDKGGFFSRFRRS